jgi:hypothetical protein
MRKNDEQKKEIKELLKEVETRLEIYHNRREEF